MFLPMSGEDDKVDTPATAGKLHGNYAKCQVRIANPAKKNSTTNNSSGVKHLNSVLFYFLYIN
jgi:hypothetical protein